MRLSTREAEAPGLARSPDPRHTHLPRLTPLHQLLQPLASCARVVQCAQAVPTLLRAFFAAVTQVSLPPRASVPAAEGQPEPGATGPQHHCRPGADLGSARVGVESATHSSPGPAPVPPGRSCEQPPRQQTESGAAQRCLWAGTQARSPSQFADGALASRLALLLLERSDALFQVEGYEADVHRWVSPGVSAGLHPSYSCSLPRPQPFSALVTTDPSSGPASALRGLPHRPFPLQRVATFPTPSFSWAEPSRRCPF